MKNKLIINIVLVYFVLLAVVLVIQMRNSNSNVSNEPLRESVHYSDVLGDSIVLYDHSPVMLVKQKQRLVSSENAAYVPIVNDKNALVPIDFFEEAYGAVVSADENRKTATVRLNNKALVVDGDNNIITLVSASKEKTLDAKADIKFNNNCAYIGLNGFAEGFDKELFIKDSLVLLSDSKLELDDEAVTGLNAEIAPQVNNLPSVDEQKKLDELLGNGAVNIFNAIGESMGLAQKENPVSSLGLDATGVDSPSAVKTDKDYMYYIKDNCLNISLLNKLEPAISSTEIDLSTIYGIYVDRDYLAVVGDSNAIGDEEKSFGGSAILIYDITERAEPKLIRQVGAEGKYDRAYKKEDTVYLFVKKEAESADSFDIPSCYDSVNAAISDEKALSDVRYVPEMADKTYTTILGINIGNIEMGLNTKTILGLGDKYTLSGDSMYIAAASAVGTAIYKMQLNNDGSVKYLSAAFTAGNVPDSACMNEYNGILRLASCNDNKVKVALLDEKLDSIDSIDDISANGAFVSARFIGSRGYLVSDSTTEPVFAVDLTDEPKKIGAIKIPSDATAVRNFDADHFICFKKDGSVAMLNITDMDNQLEQFTIQTGGICDTNAIYLNVDDGLLAVPVEMNTFETTTEITTISVDSVSEATTMSDEISTEAVEQSSEAETQAVQTSADEVNWQGVCLYKVDIQNNAFVPIDKITHMDNGYDEECKINNLVYKNNVIYTFSDKKIACKALQ